MSDETTTPTLRRCSGSARFGIEPHEAASDDFPRQPSQKDGLGRMCKRHWNAYTAGLARDAKARNAAEAGAAPAPEAETASEAPVTAPRRRPRQDVTPAAGAPGDAG